jgi:hypothetical protein
MATAEQTMIKQKKFGGKRWVNQ